VEELTEQERFENFRTELAALLENHGASLDLIIEGDTHGVYDEGLGVSFLPSKTGRWTKTKRLSSDYSTTSKDLKAF